jgi:hypothetical protein
MKCKYTFRLESRSKFPTPLYFTLGVRTYALETDDGRLTRLSVTVDNFPDDALPRVTTTPQYSIHFPIDGHLEFIRMDVRALEGALALWGIHRIDTERFRTEWIPENPADRAKLTIFTFDRTHNEDVLHSAASIDLLIRTIVSVDEFRGLEVPLNFNRRGRLAVIQERYIEAIYEFYFFIESLYGNGKFKQNAVIQEFTASNDLNAAIDEALADPDFEFKADPMLSTHFQRHYAMKTKPEIIEHLVDLRGFLHHHSIKNKRSWNPGQQSDYKADALFWESVCHAAAMRYCTDILFRPEEIQKFASTPVRKPDGSLIEWNPPPSVILP